MRTNRKNKSNPGSRKIRLLIVEDNPDHRFIIESALQKSFPAAHYFFFDQPEAFHDFLRKCNLDLTDSPVLVLLDLYCPDRENGLRILTAIRAMEGPLQTMPVVIFSSSEDDEDILASYEKGANTYVPKPADYTDWQRFFESLQQHWMSAVSMPSEHVFSGGQFFAGW